MGNLAEMNDSAKVAFLMEVVRDACSALARKGDIDSAARYLSYVYEMRGEQQTKENSHE